MHSGASMELIGMVQTCLLAFRPAAGQVPQTTVSFRFPRESFRYPSVLLIRRSADPLVGLRAPHDRSHLSFLLIGRLIRWFGYVPQRMASLPMYSS